MTSSNSWNVQCLSQKPVIPRDSTHQSSHLVSKQHPRRPKAAPRPSSIPGSCTHKASQSNKTSGYDFTLQASGSMSKHHMHRKYVASKSNTILNKTLWTDQIWSDCTPVIHLYNNPEIDERYQTASTSSSQMPYVIKKAGNRPVWPSWPSYRCKGHRHHTFQWWMPWAKR